VPGEGCNDPLSLVPLTSRRLLLSHSSHHVSHSARPCIQYNAVFSSANASPVPLTSALASRRGIGEYPPLSAPSGPGSSSPSGRGSVYDDSLSAQGVPPGHADRPVHLADGESERRERPAGRVKLSVVNMKENSRSQRNAGRHRGRRARASPEWSVTRTRSTTPQAEPSQRAIASSGRRPEARPEKPETPYKNSIDQS